MKEETAAEGYTVAESIVFHLNDTGVEQRVVMDNEHETGLAGELVESSDGTGTISGTGDLFPFALVVLSVSLIVSGLVIRRRAI